MIPRPGTDRPCSNRVMNPIAPLCLAILASGSLLSGPARAEASVTTDSIRIHDKT